MNRLRCLLTCSGLSLGLLAATAQAIPPVLERVPDDAMMAVAIPAPTQLEKNIKALSVAIDQEFPLPSVKDMLSMGGFNTGVDETKSMGVVIFAPKKKDAKPAAPGDKPKDEAGDDMDDDFSDFEPSEDNMIFLLPITSYAALLENFNAKPAGEGKVDAIETPTGEPGFVRDIGGGYAALGSKRELVESFTGKPGANPVKSRIGKAGEALADASDFVTIYNMDALRPLAEEGIKEARAAAKEQAEGMGQDIDKQMAVVNWMTDTIVRDTTFGVSGIKIGGSGISMDAVGQFKADSYLAKVFATKANSSALLKKVPGGRFLFAGAMDTSHAALKQLFLDINSRAVNPGGEDARKIAAANLELTDGTAGVVGFPEGGAIAGLLTSAVTFTQTKSPDVVLQNMKKNILAMNGHSEQGVTIKTQVKDPTGENPFSTWSMTMESDADNEMMTQGMAFIFGPEGRPSGYMAKNDSGVFTTFARNSDLMNNALKVGNGVAPVSDDKLLLGTQEQLPANRIAEGYVGTKSILDLVLPFAAMAGVPVPADSVPEKLPPVGMALASDQGAARFSMFIPAQVIKTGVALGQGFSDMQDDGMNGGEDEPADKPKNGPTGQPRF